jgi:flagellar hook-length control protein FliK
MAQIDTLSSPKTISTVGSGINSAAKSSSPSGLFDQILSGQAGAAEPAVSGGSGQTSGNNLPDNAGAKPEFSDQQLQGLAVKLGIDPAVAKLVLEGTAKVGPASGSLTDADVIMVRGQQVATQSFLQQREARAVNQMADKKMELANTINIMLTRGKPQAASTVASAAASNTATTFAGITLAPSLVQKLDQFTSAASATHNTTNSLEGQGLGSYTGANFKAAASLSHMPPTAGASMGSDVSTMDLSQRFTSLMQGDSSAQVAARQMHDQLGQQLQRMVKEGRWQANLSLHPARLGQVNINLMMEDGVLQTQLLSGNAGVRELLESSLPRLREQLEGSGLQLSDVSVASDNQGQQQSRGEEPDWQLTQAVRTPSAEQMPTTAVNNRSSHDGDVDTFA